MPSQPKIFISYATPDRNRVAEVYDFLTANNYTDVWIDYKSILGGQRWDFEIKRNLQKADIVLVFFSNNSITRRGYVQRELKIVFDNLQEKLLEDIYVIPVKLDTGVETPELLSELQWIDINNDDSLGKIKASLEAQTEKLGLETPINVEQWSDIQITKSTVKESWEGIPGYEVEYSVPNFRSNTYKNIGEITKIIEAALINSLHSHRSMKLEQMPDSYSWAQNKYQRTSTFDASYSNIYQSYNFISFHYTIHWYGAGAAHPNYHFTTYNFFLEPLLEVKSLEDLFEPEENVFEQLATLVRGELIKEYLERINQDSEDPDTQLEDRVTRSIIEGTESWANLSCFTFSEKGITIFFDPYQVASYAMGSFTVDVPYVDLPAGVKRTFLDALPIRTY